MQSPDKEASVADGSFIYERDYLQHMATVHSSSVLFYRRSDEVKAVGNACIPELQSCRSASEIRQVGRLLAKSSPSSFSSTVSASPHPKFSLIVAEVDHTIIKFMEVLHKYYENEKKMSARLPLLLLMSPKVEDDLQQFVKTCDDVFYIMTSPFSPQSVFEMIVAMLHRRHVADDLYNRLTKSDPSKHISETKFGMESTTTLVAEATSSLAEEFDEEDLSMDIALTTTGVSINQYLESSKALLPKVVHKMREYYMKELRRNNIYEMLEKYSIDAHERSRIDEMILNNLKRGLSHSSLLVDTVYETLSLEAVSESKDDDVSRINPRVPVESDPAFRMESCNIMSESSRPIYNVNDSTESNMFSSEILPFVDRPRPNMTKPRTVAGLYQKNASACWKVMKTKTKLSNVTESKHDRPWSTPHMKARKTVSKPITDDHGTMTLETFLKIRDQISKQENGNPKVMEEAIPVETSWERPKIQRKSTQQKRDEFKVELEKTKKMLADNSHKTPPISRRNSQGSQGNTTPVKKGGKILSMNSVISDQVEKPISQNNRTTALGTMREWRGVSEQVSERSLERKMSNSSDIGTPRKLSGDATASREPRKLSHMLRSTGGLNFGNLVTSGKARDKAKRMVNSMALTVSHDPQTSRLIMVNLENRRVSSFDRENLMGGINQLLNDRLEIAYKSFSKAIMVCKQVHIAMIYRGIVQYRRGKFFNALEDFTNASKNIESSNILIKNHMEDILIARFNRGITLFRLGDDEPGLQDIKFALAVNPNNIHVRSMLMQVQRRSCNYIEAVDHCMFIKKVGEEEAALLAESTANSTSAHGDKIEEQKSSKMSYPSPNSKKLLKRGLSGFESMLDLLSSSSEAFKPKNVDVEVKVPESCFPGLQERKRDFLNKKTREDSAQNSMFLENFKHANGYKRHMFDTHFIQLSEVQGALIQSPYMRTPVNKSLIMRCLKSYPIFCDLKEDLLLELAGCVEYRAVNKQNVVFFQGDPVDAVVLVLSGQLQLRQEGQGGGIPTAVVAELEQFDMYGHFACIFNSTNTGFLQRMHHICQDAENGYRSDFSPQALSDPLVDHDIATESFNAHDLPRALQPGSFMTCKVASPTEMILVHKSDFDRLLRFQTEIQFFKRLELLKASGIFSGDFPYYDLVRLGRMCVLRRYRQGEVILSQGEVPDFVYFVLKGICKAKKRPDPTEYLSQRLLNLRTKVDKFEELYTFHHSLRNHSVSSNTVADSGRKINQMDTENEHQSLKAEIARLEVVEAKEIILEKKRRQVEKELILLGHDIPDRFVDVASLHWPQVFGEAAILQPDTGVSAGTIIADTNCHVMCMHKSHLKTFVISKKIMDNMRDRSVVYPSHEKLVMQLADKDEWADYRAETLNDISKDRWPGCQALKPQAFYI